MVQPSPDARVLALVDSGDVGIVQALGGRLGEHRWLFVSFYLEGLETQATSWVSSEFVRIDRSRGAEP